MQYDLLRSAENVDPAEPCLGAMLQRIRLSQLVTSPHVLTLRAGEVGTWPVTSSGNHRRILPRTMGEERGPSHLPPAKLIYSGGSLQAPEPLPRCCRHLTTYSPVGALEVFRLGTCCFRLSSSFCAWFQQVLISFTYILSVYACRNVVISRWPKNLL